MQAPQAPRLHPFFVPVQAEPLTQEIEQRHPRVVERNHARLPVDDETDGERHACSIQSYDVRIAPLSEGDAGPGVEKGSTPESDDVLSPGQRAEYTEGASEYQEEPERERTWGSQTAKKSRKPRADSILNRERLLEAATEIFAAGGPQASLEAVARRAELGIGTLYLAFPDARGAFAGRLPI